MEISEERSDDDIEAEFDQRGDINHQVCKVAVWALYTLRAAEALLLTKEYGAILTEDQLLELGHIWYHRWQMDRPRSVRNRCFLCNEKLPRLDEVPCRCIREVVVGEIIDLSNPKAVYDYVRQHGDKAPVYSYFCRSPRCSRVEDWRDEKKVLLPAYVVLNYMEQGKRFDKSKLKFCQPCFIRQKREQTPQRHPSLKGAEAPVTNKLGEKIPVKELQEEVAESTPPAAES